MGLITIRANAIASTSAGLTADTDFHVVGTHYIQGVNVYLAATGQTLALTAAGRADYESQLAQIARGDYIIING